MLSHLKEIVISAGNIGLVQSLSVQLFVTPWIAACQAPLSFTVSQNLFQLMSTESMMLYLTISSFATPFSFCLQSFPASGSFPMRQLLASGGQSNVELALRKHKADLFLPDPNKVNPKGLLQA